MSWTDEPPKDYELLSNSKSSSDWTKEPPRPEELIPDNSNKLGAGLEGFGQGATMGYLNALQAGIEPAVFAAGNLLTGQDIPSDDYDARKEYYVNRRKDLASENPGSYIAGNIAGGLTTGIATSPLTAARGATVLGRMGQQAAIGAATGGLQNTDSNDADIMQRLKNAGFGALLGGGFQGVTEGVSYLAPKAISAAKSYFNGRKVKNAEQIEKAAETLGTKATPGMTSSNDRVQRLEQSLSESPSLFGQNIKSKVDDVYKKGQEGIEDILDGATTQNKFQLGEDMKRGVLAQVAEDLAPSSMAFDEVAKSTKGIEISKKSMDAVKRNIENLDEVRLLGLEGAPAKYVQRIGNVRSVDDLKTLGTLIQKDIQASQGTERQVLIAIKDKLRAAEESNIMREAVNLQRASKLKSPLKEGRNLVGELKGARKEYAQKMGSYRDLADSTNLGQVRGGSGLSDIVEGVRSENLPDKLFNLNNEQGLMELQKSFPEVYELAKNGKLSAIKDKVMNGDVFSIKNFAKEYKAMSPQAKERMFTGNVNKAEAVSTIANNFPKNYNPSGTASQAAWNMDFIASNFKDIPKYAAYKLLTSPTAAKIADNLVSRSAKYAQMATSKPEVFAQFVNNMAGRMSEDNTKAPQEQPPQSSNNKLEYNKDEIIQKAQGSKYAQVLQNAAQKGDQSLAAAHFVLSSRDKAYRDHMNNGGNNSGL